MTDHRVKEVTYGEGWLVLMLLLALTGRCHAQGEARYWPNVTPETRVVEVSIDTLSRMTAREFPLSVWVWTVTCGQRHGVVLPYGQGMPPRVVVIPHADVIRLPEGGTAAAWSFPGLGLTGVVLVAERYATSVPVLKHEASHHVEWRRYRNLGEMGRMISECGSLAEGASGTYFERGGINR